MTTDSNSPSTPKPSAWRRRLRRAALIYVVLPYVAILVIMTTFQRSLIYRPTKTRLLAAKSVVGSEVQTDDVELHAANGLTLHGWHFHAKLSGEREQKVLILYFPGNGGCRADRVTDCRDFTELGCDVVLFDYRGYGDNGGSPSEELLASDARRAWMFATRELEFPAERIVLFGESLGGAVATRLAAEFSQAGDPPAALILNSAFASLGETVAWHYPAFPFQYLLLDRYPSFQRIPHVTCSVLQFHGTDDDIVAYSHGQHLFAAAPAMSASGIKKKFVTIQGGQHNFIGVGDMQAAIIQLLTEIAAHQ